MSNPRPGEKEIDPKLDQWGELKAGQKAPDGSIKQKDGTYTFADNKTVDDRPRNRDGSLTH